MNIKYKIISFHPEMGNIQVNYYCDEVPNGLTYAIDIPVQNGQFASQDLIDNLIKTFEPRGQLERIAELSNAVIPDHLSSYIQNTPTPADKINSEIPSPAELSISIQEAMANGKTMLNGAPILPDVIGMFPSE